ncbi:MAG: WYL domain-containing protein [Propionibacteriaceae bacterium]|jgi:proteasome accessory factor B|nr:WYL domain-containing protein [Propionibacteriaceae bacterium]
MAAQSSERLLNLVIALLATRRYLSRDELRSMVAGYSRATTEQGFLRMFERDKQDLRAMGVTIQTGGIDPVTEEVDGYRIEARDFYLPELSLTPAESTLVGLASSVWAEPGVAEDVKTALAKLRASGQSVDGDAVSYLTPRLTARDPGFAVLWEALLTRTPVKFTYHDKPRLVHPWRLILRSGAWYLLGQDTTAGVRLFKVTRVQDLPQLSGEPGAYELPSPDQIADHASQLDPPAPTAAVTVALREGAGVALRRRAHPVQWPSQVLEGYEVVQVPYAREDEIVSAICACGPDAVVLSDGDIKRRVIEQLTVMSTWGREQS